MLTTASTVGGCCCTPACRTFRSPAHMGVTAKMMTDEVHLSGHSRAVRCRPGSWLPVRWRRCARDERVGARRAKGGMGSARSSAIGRGCGVPC
jgi:hypothetical protein